MKSKHYIGHVLEIRNELNKLFMGNKIDNPDDPSTLFDTEIACEVDIQITVCQELFREETSGRFKQPDDLPPRALLRLLDVKAWVLEKILEKYNLVPKE